MPAGKAVSPARKEEIAKMGRLDYSAQRIADAFGLNHHTVRKICREKGVELKPGRKFSYIYGD